MDDKFKTPLVRSELEDVETAVVVIGDGLKLKAAAKEAG